MWSVAYFNWTGRLYFPHCLPPLGISLCFEIARSFGIWKKTFDCRVRMIVWELCECSWWNIRDQNKTSFERRQNRKTRETKIGCVSKNWIFLYTQIHDYDKKPIFSIQLRLIWASDWKTSRVSSKFDKLVRLIFHC